MQQFHYFVILHDGRAPDYSLINPRFLTINGLNRFQYKGPNPGFWRGEIQRRHSIATQFEVFWERGQNPAVPQADYDDETGHREPLLLVYP